MSDLDDLLRRLEHCNSFAKVAEDTDDAAVGNDLEVTLITCTLVIREALNKLAQPGVFTEGAPPDQKPECLHPRTGRKYNPHGELLKYCRDCRELL